MLRLKRGRIVFISSVVGLLGSAGQVNYAASKAGLVGFARSLTRELGSRGITANVVAPGFVETDMTAALTDDQKTAIKTQIPPGRFADAEEIARRRAAWLPADGAATSPGRSSRSTADWEWGTETDSNWASSRASGSWSPAS